MSIQVRSSGLCLLAFLALLFLIPTHAAAQCDDSTRAAFLADVEKGASEAELEASYGHCRNSTPVAPEGDDGLATKSTSSSNTFWERMNGCGYHPQARVMACDVEIRRTTGYGAFGPPPAGSFEYVRFCLDCPILGNWDVQIVSSVHVTDNNFATNPAPTPSWYHLAFASTTVCSGNDGRQMRMRTILSWAVPPPPCAAGGLGQQPLPIFGMAFEETIRRDP